MVWFIVPLIAFLFWMIIAGGVWFIVPFITFLFGMIIAGGITFVFVKLISFPQNTWGCSTIMFFLILTFVFGVFLTYFFSYMGWAEFIIDYWWKNFNLPQIEKNLSEFEKDNK